MSRSALFAQLGIVDEVTYGTYVAPTRWLEFTEEDVKLDIERNESEGIRTGQRVLRQDHWKAGKRQAAGGITLEVPNKGFGLVLKHMLGTIATAASGTGKKHTATIGDLWGDMFTAQFGRPDISGTVQPYSYLGCKIAEWELSNSPDEFLLCSLTIDARDETTAQALAAASAPTATDIFHWAGGSFTIGGSATPLIDFSLQGNNGLKTDRFFLAGTNLKSQPIQAAMAEITGEVTVDFDGLTQYNRFVGGTHAAIVGTWVSALEYDTGLPFKVVVTLPACRFDGETPGIEAGETLQQAMPIKVVDDGTNPPISIDYYTSDASP